MTQDHSTPLLEITSLQVKGRERHLVHGIELRVDEGERVALLGASGSGKSLTASAILGTLHPSLEATGQLSLDGRPIALRAPISTRIGLASIGQDSRAALNPLVTIGSQIRDAAQRAGATRQQAAEQCLVLLAQLGFEDAERIAASHAGGLSGGQRQRACIALALATRPRLVIADEPTTALDVISQAEVVRALDSTTGKDGTGLLFITHDVPVAAQLCSRAVVLSEGRVVEEAPMAKLLTEPRADYSRRLIAAARAEMAALRGEKVVVA